jgi:hypothetical protein
MACFGKWGMMVPAVTTSPSSNFTRAKSLASASVAKVRVDRGLRRLTNLAPLGTSNVTYQLWFIRHRPDGVFGEPSAPTCAVRDLRCRNLARKRHFGGRRRVDPDQRAPARGRAPSTRCAGWRSRNARTVRVAIAVQQNYPAIRLSVGVSTLLDISSRMLNASAGCRAFLCAALGTMALVLGAVHAKAQDAEPRAYSNTPVGLTRKNADISRQQRKPPLAACGAVAWRLEMRFTKFWRHAQKSQRAR